MAGHLPSLCTFHNKFQNYRHIAHDAVSFQLSTSSHNAAEANTLLQDGLVTTQSRNFHSKTEVHISLMLKLHSFKVKIHNSR